MNLIIPKNDEGYYLYFTVLLPKEKPDDPDVPFILTGYTVTLKVWQAGKPDDLLLEGECNLVSGGTGGICRYLVVADDFAVVGRYRGELELTKENVIESTEIFTIKVLESA